MSRSNQNLMPLENWRSRSDYDPYSTRSGGTNTMASVYPAGAPMEERRGGEIYPRWSGPATFMSFPVPPYFHHQNQFPDYGAARTTTTRYSPVDAPPSFSVQWNVQAPEEGSRLTQDEQKKVLNKLKKEIYNPTPKWLKRRPSLYYRDNPIHSSRETENDKDDDGKRCAVCLEDFEPKELVTVTPCNHMFHEECIIPWVKSQGQCPVCRFAIGEKFRENAAPSRIIVGNNQFESELMTIIRGMREMM